MNNQALKNFQYQFAPPAEEIIVPTGMMLEVISRTAAVHPGNSIWYGDSRIGKTTTAKFMVQQIMKAYDPQNPHAYRAAHYEVGEIREWTGNEMKQGVKSLYYATLGRFDEGIYRHDPTESVATHLVHGLRRKNIQMIFIDEAGTLSLEAMRGMVLVGDIAKNMNYPLSLVFIGMDDLPTKVRHLPQVDKRCVEWCYFEAYSLNDTANLLAELHPHFGRLDFNNPKHYEQVKCIYDLMGGFPGLIVPFLRKLEHCQRQVPEEITTTYLRTIHLRTVMDRKQSVNKSLDIYQGRPPKDSRSGAVRRGKQDKESASDEKSAKRSPGKKRTG
jgi:hypothetical protein